VKNKEVLYYLMPWPGPHEMSLTRTSEQLPTIDTQSSPDERQLWKVNRSFAGVFFSEAYEFDY
jgi:hypothetical protein